MYITVFRLLFVQLLEYLLQNNIELICSFCYAEIFFGFFDVLAQSGNSCAYMKR